MPSTARSSGCGWAGGPPSSWWARNGPSGSSSTDDHTLSIGPSLAFTRYLFGPDFYFLARPDEYQHQRKTLLPLFRAHMAPSHLAIMERHCAAFVARLGESGTFDLPQEMNALILGIIMEAFLGADFVRHMPSTVASDFRDFIRGLDPITPAWVPTPHRMRARRARDRMRAAAGELVRLGVTFAGHDSTTGHVSWALIALLQHPGELAKVLAEQDQILPGGPAAPLDVAAIHRMNGLDRALHETARLRPVAPVMLRRLLRPVQMDGLAIPAGADVFVAPVLSHRLPVLFENADRYDPDRYLANPKQTSHLHGFGGGTHRCLGEHFADLLTHVTVTRLLQNYELTLVTPDPLPVPTPAFKGPRSPCLIRYQAKPPVNHR